MTKVQVNFIQDRSGSMASVWSETLSGFRTFVKDLKSQGAKDDIQYSFTLTVFDTLIDIPLNEVEIDKVSEDILTKYEPRGCTALYDAVGKTIETMGKSKADKVICVIVTDGQENSSREWSKDAVHSAIDAKIAAGNWTFTYLGTQPETWTDASSLGVGIGATATYQGTQAQAAYATVANALHNFSRSAQLNTNCFMSYSDPVAVASAGMSTRVDPSEKKPKPVSSKAMGKAKSWRAS